MPTKKLQKDNSTLASKVRLRRAISREIYVPVVLETHGGWGEVWKYCYQDISCGVVIEKDVKKASFLAQQRPNWLIYQCDCEVALMGGVGDVFGVNIVDFDPYGDPWPSIDALFRGDRDWPSPLAIVVNDGLRQKLKMNGGWTVESMLNVVNKYGNYIIYDNYLEICQELLIEKAAQRGYSLSRWLGNYCGHAKQMTHYGGGVSEGIIRIFMRDSRLWSEHFSWVLLPDPEGTIFVFQAGAHFCSISSRLFEKKGDPLSLAGEFDGLCP